MSNPLTRSIPALGAAAVLGLGGTVTGAFAHGDHHGHGHGKRHGTDHGEHRGQHRYSAADAMYLQTAIEGDLFEIQGGTLAQQKGGEKVKAYGAKLVADHTKSLKDATELAKKLGIEVPKAPTPSEQWELQVIGTLDGAAFDQQYADLEAKDHQQDISEASDEVEHGSNHEIRSSAKDEIPTLREHLDTAKSLGGHEGTDPTGG